MHPASLISIVLLGGPQCGRIFKIMAAAEMVETTSGHAADPRIHRYLALDERDKKGRRIFRYSGRTRERHATA